MSFYEIVFGFLFVGAARLFFLFLVDTPDLAGFLSAATLCILVVCDAMTTVLVGDDRNVYKTRLMLLDLLGSFCLAGAVLLRDTTSQNGPFQLSVNQAGVVEHRVPLFWGCLAVYMAGASLWNREARTYRDICDTLRTNFARWQPGMAVMFALFSAAAFAGDAGVADFGHPRTDVMLSGLGVLAVLAYLFCFKISLFASLNERADAAKAAEGRRSQIAAWLMTNGAPVGTGDAVRVSAWPPYTGQEAAYNYALAVDHGWLATRNTYAQYKVVDDSGIVAVAMLTRLENGTEDEVELFVLVREDRRNRGIGTKLTEAVVDSALYERGFERVVLQVRDWNIHAQATYRRAGFVQTMTGGKPKESSGRFGGVDAIRMLWMHCTRVTRERAIVASLPKSRRPR